MRKPIFGIMLILAILLGYLLATRTLVGQDAALMFIGVALGAVTGLLSRVDEAA